ncbi:MAG TPA: hypothetical protein VFE16_05330 [Candidatus Cybelea sp.]|jgi:DNA-binding beta-propeller fold protein YncE|nr:hypothetical protein [Candidatus Cybelea sp.]
MPPIGAPGAIGSSAVQAATAGDLLYVTGNTGTFAYVYMLSYPAGKVVGKIDKQIAGLCSDAQGNVYMTQSYHSTSTIFEYAHGAKKPKATLVDPYNGASGCAVDRTTGNLAVANQEGNTVVVYAHARGKPKRYYIWFAPDFVAYNPKGELFVTGGGSPAGFAELLSGQFRRVSMTKRIEFTMGVQWDGTYMALGEASGTYSDGLIRQYTIVKHKAIWQSGTKLGTFAYSFFIEGSTVVVADGYRVYFFAYPAGGEPTKTIGNLASPYALTVSLAP